MEIVAAIYGKFSAFFNALAISFFASFTRYTFERRQNKCLRDYMGFWILASFVVFIATLIVDGMGIEGNFATAVVGLSGFAARELLELVVSVVVKISPAIAEKLQKIIGKK